MDAQASIIRPDKPSSLAEVIAITVSGVLGLAGFGAGLVTQDTATALEGLAIFLATYFYTLMRASQLARVDDDEIDRRATPTSRAGNFWSWVDNLPKAVFHNRGRASLP